MTDLKQLRPKTRKGFIKVDISSYVPHPGTPAEQEQLDWPGDWHGVEPIMYDVIENDDAPLEIPKGLLKELELVLGSISQLVRTHKPDTEKLQRVGVKPGDIKTLENSLVDASGKKMRNH